MKNLNKILYSISVLSFVSNAVAMDDFDSEVLELTRNLSSLSFSSESDESRGNSTPVAQQLEQPMQFRLTRQLSNIENLAERFMAGLEQSHVGFLQPPSRVSSEVTRRKERRVSVHRNRVPFEPYNKQ